MPADQTQPLATKAFASAFVGKSFNNRGFMAAILWVEGLLACVEGKPHLHQVVGEWEDWKRAMLALPGEPYEVVQHGGDREQLPSSANGATSVLEDRLAENFR